MTRGDWSHFEELVRQCLFRKFGWLEEKPPYKKGSRPDFVHHHWYIFHRVIDAKDKPSGITFQDIYKLQRDMLEHDVGKGILYISSETKVDEKMIRHAHAVGIYFVRLGWNGHASEEF